MRRGHRNTPWRNFLTSDWQRNEYGVDVPVLSADPVSGALTIALRTPDGLTYPEEAHFYTCDQDLYQFEGEFHHDAELRFHAGDYVYRPPGTVYGNSIGSEGGIIIAFLNAKPVRYHFQDHPEPWDGEYLVDRLWNVRPVQPLHIPTHHLDWVDSDLHPMIHVKKLRGDPGKVSQHYGSCEHSPWGADSAFIMRIQEGYTGEILLWDDMILEAFVVDGSADIAGVRCERGSYTFGHLKGRCEVSTDLILYVRAFAESYVNKILKQDI